MSRNRIGSSGFTIIELLIATLVFSTILLLCATGLITIGRMYQKGNTSRATQEVSRNVMNIIESDFELSGGSYKPFASGGVNAFCIGDNLYAYQLNNKFVPGGINTHAFVAITSNSACNLAGKGKPFPTTLDVLVAFGAHELLGPNMRVTNLTIHGDPSDTNAQAASIHLAIAYGDSDLIAADGSCKGGYGQEFCASSVLETYVTRRLQ